MILATQDFEVMSDSGLVDDFEKYEFGGDFSIQEISVYANVNGIYLLDWFVPFGIAKQEFESKQYA